MAGLCLHGAFPAHRLGARQGKRIEGNIRESFYSEMYTLLMRLVWFPTIESAFALAVATTLAWSGWLALHHDITIGAATTVTRLRWGGSLLEEAALEGSPAAVL